SSMYVFPKHPILPLHFSPYLLNQFSVLFLGNCCLEHFLASFAVIHPFLIFLAVGYFFITPLIFLSCSTKKGIDALHCAAWYLSSVTSSLHLTHVPASTTSFMSLYFPPDLYFKFCFMSWQHGALFPNLL